MSFRSYVLLLIGLFLLMLPARPARAQSSQPAEVRAKMVDDFEADRPGQYPKQWKYVASSKEVVPLEEQMSEREEFRVFEEEGNKFLRAFTHGEAQRITMRNGPDFSWDLRERPRLQWVWRARQLPEGAREDGPNDAGGAVYVTFGADWIGRPKSIKYTYSSSLPVGTVLKQGPLRVLVLATAKEGIGRWKVEQRDVIADYRQVFGGSPPHKPVSITLWSDSDTTGGTAEVDFDDIELLPPRRP